MDINYEEIIYNIFQKKRNINSTRTESNPLSLNENYITENNINCKINNIDEKKKKCITDDLDIINKKNILKKPKTKTKEKNKNNNIKNKPDTSLKKHIISLSNVSSLRTPKLKKDKFENYLNQKFEKYNKENLRYQTIKKYSNCKPNKQNFLERMDFYSIKKQKKNEIIKLIVDQISPKMKEKERKKVFNHLIDDSNRRIEEKNNINDFSYYINNEKIKRKKKI